MIEWRRVVLEYPCQTCGSPPGIQCITTGGKPLRLPHVDRTNRASANGWHDPASVGDSPVKTTQQER